MGKGKLVLGAIALYVIASMNKKPAKKDPIIYIDVLEPAPDDRSVDDGSGTGGGTGAPIGNWRYRL